MTNVGKDGKPKPLKLHYVQMTEGHTMQRQIEATLAGIESHHRTLLVYGLFVVVSREERERAREVL